jgi:hypothetical protein
VCGNLLSRAVQKILYGSAFNTKGVASQSPG